MDLKEERHMILDMVSEGKISVEEAKQLLDTLEQSVRDKRSSRRRGGRRTVEFQIPPMPDIPKIVRRSLRPLEPYMEMAYDDLEAQFKEMEEELECVREELRIMREDTHQDMEGIKQDMEDE